MADSTVALKTETNAVADVAPMRDASTAFLAFLKNAASDPTTDMDKVERLFGMYERVELERKKSAYNRAMAMAQAEMAPVVKNQRNKQTSSNYADLAAIADAITPIYTRHGFGVSFSTKSAAEGLFGLVAEVTHEGGFDKRYEYEMPSAGKGLRGNDNMTPTHAFGTNITYLRRYAKLMIFDIATKDDADGNAPKQPATRQDGDDAPISEAQYKELSGLITETKTDIDKFLIVGGIQSLSELDVGGFKRARSMLLTKKAEQGKTKPAATS